jgi:hypothetical protein
MSEPRPVPGPLSREALQAEVDRLLAGVPRDRHCAILGVASTDGSWRVTARAAWVDGHWVVQGDLSGRGRRDLAGTISVLASW